MMSTISCHAWAMNCIIRNISLKYLKNLKVKSWFQGYSFLHEFLTSVCFILYNFTNNLFIKISLNQFQEEINKFSAENKKLEENNARLEGSIDKMGAENKKLEESNAKLQGEINRLQKEVQKMVEENKKFAANNEKLESQVYMLCGW